MTDTQYYEVDIEYTTGAKMILLGKNEDDIRNVLATEFSDVPNMNILNIQLADPEVVAQAQAQRAFDEAEQNNKKVIN